MSYIKLDQSNIENEHICCAISDKKCSDSYDLKKRWLKNEFNNGYTFLRLDERAKVFIEYGPTEKAWIPVDAPNYMNIGCFWVSGKYKKKGHGKALLEKAIADAKEQGKDGLVTVVGKKKYHFMSDTKWLLKQGFEVCQEIPSGFILISLNFNKKTNKPRFSATVTSGECPEKDGYVVYYSNRCPYAEYHVKVSLAETVEKRNIKLKTIKLKTIEEAQTAPTPDTIFSLFYNGKFITTDISVCMDSRFDKIVEKCID
ncbi:Acetyltransferase (GNAT) family protein [Natronincola peptidivorans]|uniref:Acetyltransferase (GNAT) family protein n=1 Tax=Natronincola peptidivorans TaxID=426128 RepID=A0A1I0DEG0_9FIRM|nr:GNAT family N-acetyltransferase [Natronincola peptidivorans]SET30417.1 Acetyltransferase (GNAT) family protein [Natronincola peptidivorans]